MELQREGLDVLRQTVNGNMQEIEDFFDVPLPSHIKNVYKNKQISKKLDQEQIMGIIDFTPPFLRIKKMAVFGDDRDILQSKSISMGVVTLRDTAGHYNDSIFLAMCGWLMGSAASIHLAALFPSFAPQVIEVDHIRPLKDKTLWKPNKNDSCFFVETVVLKKRMQVLVVNVRIFFGDIFMGEVDRLKLVLIPRESIKDVKELPFWG